MADLHGEKLRGLSGLANIYRKPDLKVLRNVNHDDALITVDEKKQLKQLNALVMKGSLPPVFKRRVRE